MLLSANTTDKSVNKVTQLSDEFTFEQYLKKYKGGIIPMFAIDDKQRLHVFVVNGEMRPEPSWTIIAMIDRES